MMLRSQVARVVAWPVQQHCLKRDALPVALCDLLNGGWSVALAWCCPTIVPRPWCAGAGAILIR